MPEFKRARGRLPETSLLSMPGLAAHLIAFPHGSVAI
jgi:hypothetical protein